MLSDNFGRHLTYLRLSLTKLCNFRCGYCLPDGYRGGANQPLSLDEIRRLIRIFAEFGVEKVRLSGGEPTLRSDFIEIAAMIRTFPEIKKIAFTTNGYRLEKQAHAYVDAGLNAISVSLDSLDAKIFHQITGHNRLPEVLRGIEQAVAAGFESVKVNVVLHKGLNDNDLVRFLAWVKTTPISVRFIELMQTGNNRAYFDRYYTSAQPIREALAQAGWQLNRRERSAGPAEEFSHEDYQGSIGLITPYSQAFCKTCNRLRVSSEGNLHLCLFAPSRRSLRELLQRDDQQPALKALITEQLTHKALSHSLHAGKTGMTANFDTIGG
jgi:GTP 3',8-cyclase